MSADTVQVLTLLYLGLLAWLPVAGIVAYRQLKKKTRSRRSRRRVAELVSLRAQMVEKQARRRRGGQHWPPPGSRKDTGPRFIERRNEPSLIETLASFEAATAQLMGSVRRGTPAAELKDEIDKLHRHALHLRSRFDNGGN